MKRILSCAALALLIFVISGCDKLKWAAKGIKCHSTYLNNPRRLLVYACSVTDDVSWDDMEEYARSRSWRERGITIVIFFDSPENTPDITECGWEFSRIKYEEHNVAVWFKDKHKKEYFLEGPVHRRDVPFQKYLAGEDV